MAITSTKHLIASIAIVTAIIATLPLTRTAEAAYCKQTVVDARGLGGSITSARNRAWQNWQTKVQGMFGINWSVPQYATLKSENCHHTTCVVKARPCLHLPQ